MIYLHQCLGSSQIMGPFQDLMMINNEARQVNSLNCNFFQLNLRTIYRLLYLYYCMFNFRSFGVMSKYFTWKFCWTWISCAKKPKAGCSANFLSNDPIHLFIYFSIYKFLSTKQSLNVAILTIIRISVEF